MAGPLPSASMNGGKLAASSQFQSASSRPWFQFSATRGVGKWGNVAGIDQSPVLGMKPSCGKMVSMSLLDHFHPPLNINYPWHSIHHAWCTNLAVDLNLHLPEQCYALPSVQF